MKLKALVSFSGRTLSSTKGREFECDAETAKDLIQAGYAVEVKDESKRVSAGKRSASNKRKPELSE